jgi:hypothetical protein
MNDPRCARIEARGDGSEMKANGSKLTMGLLLVTGCLPAYLAGCGDDYIGTDTDRGGAASAGKGSGGKSSGGATSSAGKAQGEAGDGGESIGGADRGGAANAGGGNGGNGGKPGTGGAAGNGGAGGNGGVGGHGGHAGGGAGGTAGNAGSGGTAGTSGTAGSGGTGPRCGNGVLEGDELCDHPSGNNYLEEDCGDVWGAGNGVTGAENACLEITPAGCALCESMTDCAELTDPLAILMDTIAAEGPAAGSKRFVLYNKTLDCVRDTRCAENTALDCYCGDVSSAQCDSGNGNGACKNIIEEGLETTNPTEIVNRFSNSTLGGGLALARVACDAFSCSTECF